MTDAPDIAPTHPHPHAGSGGLSITKKIGPLPLWAYMAGVAGIYVAYRYYQAAKNPAVPATTAADTATDTSADTSGSTGGGLGGTASTGVVTATTPGTATTNAQWASLILTAEVAAGKDPELVNNSLTDYLNGVAPLPANETAEIARILATYGPPPQGLIPINTAPVTATSVPDGFYHDSITHDVYEVYNGNRYAVTSVEWNNANAHTHVPTTEVNSTWQGYKLPAGVGTPPGLSSSVAAPVGGGSAKPAPKPTPTPTTGSRTYTVKSGDSLYAIAERYYGNGNDYSKIVAANEGKYPSLKTNPSDIHVGWVLTIPS